MGSSAMKKGHQSSRRLYYDGPFSKTAPAKRMGAFSAESADEPLETPREWNDFRSRQIPRQVAPPRRH